jgi:hypothetical protein
MMVDKEPYSFIINSEEVITIFNLAFAQIEYLEESS